MVEDEVGARIAIVIEDQAEPALAAGAGLRAREDQPEVVDIPEERRAFVLKTQEHPIDHRVGRQAGDDEGHLESAGCHGRRVE